MHQKAAAEFKGGEGTIIGRHAVIRQIGADLKQKYLTPLFFQNLVAYVQEPASFSTNRRTGGRSPRPW